MKPCRFSAMLVLAGSLALTACATQDPDTAAYNDGRATRTWTTLGAILGGVAGSMIGDGDGQLAATAAGTLLGAAMGSAIGSSMDDQHAAQEAETWEPLKQGEVESWPGGQSDGSIGSPPNRQGSDSGQAGSSAGWTNATAQNTGQEATATPDGRPCRFLPAKKVINGIEQEILTRYCRQPNGQWTTEP